jgi:hydroxyacylglutathione hydrolase
MQLEDHVGDIIRKARAMSGVAPTAAATAAEMSEAELATMEATGELAKEIHFGELAKMVGLNPGKLANLVNGWLPSKQNLNRWRNLHWFTTAGEGLTVNCYLIWDEATRQAALFDTGLDAKPILACLMAEGLILQHIFITHSHWDHVEALPEIRAAFPLAQLHSGSPKAPAAQRNQPGKTVALGDLRISHRATPGHAEDGVTYLVSNWPEGAPGIAIVGDAIFAGSIGRGNQSWELARQKVREEILGLAPETLICPGHGPLTTVSEEKAHNPFFDY